MRKEDAEATMTIWKNILINLAWFIVYVLIAGVLFNMVLALVVLFGRPVCCSDAGDVVLTLEVLSFPVLFRVLPQIPGNVTIDECQPGINARPAGCQCCEFPVNPLGLL